MSPNAISHWPWLCKALLIIATLTLAVGAATACGGSGEAPPTPTPTVPTSPTEFDITNREHAAARLIYLRDVLIDGLENEHNEGYLGSISWAAARVAAARIEEVCNNFEIDKDLDLACDHLLLSLETPYNDNTYFDRLVPIFEQALDELRIILPRRELSRYSSYVVDWDGDIGESWRLPTGAYTILGNIGDAIYPCVYRYGTPNVPYCDSKNVVDRVQNLSAELFENHGQKLNSDPIFMYIASELEDLLQEFSAILADFPRYVKGHHRDVASDILAILAELRVR